MHWGKAINQRVYEIYNVEKSDVFVFRSRKERDCYFATPRLDSLAMTLLMQEGEVVYFQRRGYEEV